MRRKNIEEALTWLTGTAENGKPNNFPYTDIKIDRDLL